VVRVFNNPRKQRVQGSCCAPHALMQALVRLSAHWISAQTVEKLVA
jgi:hypothetical protein